MSQSIFRLKPSLTYTVLLTSLLLIASVIVIGLPCSSLWKSIWGAGLACQATLIWRDRRATIGLQPVQEKTWYLMNAHGERYEGILQGDSIVTHRVMVLRFKMIKRRLFFNTRVCVIFKDSMESAAYQQLLVILYTS